MSERYDAIFNGTGQAGPALAGMMSREGTKVAGAEREPVGGACVNTELLPTTLQDPEPLSR